MWLGAWRRLAIVPWLLAVLVVTGCETLDVPFLGPEVKPSPQATTQTPPPPLPGAARAPSEPPPGERVAPRVRIESVPLPPPSAAPPPVVSAPPAAAQPRAEAAEPDEEEEIVETVIPPAEEGGLDSAAPLPKAGPSKAAILLPLSGPQAALGQALLNAAQLALFEIADEDFTLLPLDTQGTPEGAARAAERAGAQGAKLILGPLFSAEVKAAAPVARRNGLNLVAFSSDRTAAQAGTYLLSILPRLQVDRVVGHARARGLSRFAALVPSNESGRVFLEAFRGAVAAQGGQVVDVETYDANAKDHNDTVKKLANYDARHRALLAQRRELEARREKGDEAAKSALARLANLETLGEVGFEALFLPEDGGRLRAIAALLPYYDIDPAKVRLLGTLLWEDPTLGAEPALAGAWYGAPPPEARAEFENRYQKNFGAKPPRIASLAYDATALAAILAQGGDFSARALANPNGFAGVDGIFRFLSDGTTERSLAVMEIQRGRHRVVSPAAQTFAKPVN
ncbi:MAG: penicillin-binding protein activator [Rhodospirillales bacterium]|nr:penicillin-binding protein activator [Rhodospirillales bacterium]